MLILASASKARQKLLDQSSIKYETIVSNINENETFNKDVKKLVQSLAEQKASSVASRIILNNDFPLYNAFLGCDSLFELNGEYFGKPSNKEEAIDRWRKMSGATGLLHTGHCFYAKFEQQSKQFKLIFKDVITTEIEFVSMSEDSILDYVDTGEPLICAGGFSLEGRGGVFIKKINGCFSNVIGLSLPWLRNKLEKANLF